MIEAPRDQKRSHLFSWIIASSWLTYWQVRHVWRILLLMGLITLLTTVILCSILLFSTVALETAIHNTFDPTSHPLSRVVRVGADTAVLTPDQISGAEHDINAVMQRYLGGLLIGSPILTIKSQKYALYLVPPDSVHPVAPQRIQVVSAPDNLIGTHLDITSGTLPHGRTDESLELVIDETTAHAWHVAVGSRVFMEIPLANSASQHSVTLMPISIVGIYAPHQNDSLFGHFFSDTSISSDSNQIYTAFGNFGAILTLSEQQTSQASNTDNLSSYNWTYTIDTNYLQLDQLDHLITQGNALAAQLQNSAPDWHHLTSAYLDENGFFTTIGSLQTHATLFQTPVTILIIELLLFIVFFISIIGEFVIAWQSDVITALRSRGMERSQIFGAFSIQAFIIGFMALLVGPLIAATLVELISDTVFFQKYDSLTLQHISTQAWSVAGYAGGGVSIMIFAMIIAIMRAADMNVLTSRREIAREAQVPFWRRFYLDVALAMIGSVGFIIYHQIEQNLGAYIIHTNQYLMLFSILAPLILVVALALLFFRIFPVLLRLCAHLASINRGAVPIIALAKIARAPRQATYTTLLLAIAICITLFTIVTLATQQQRAYDIATYTVGSDFQGLTSPISPESIEGITARYRAFPGVISASSGVSLTVPYSGGDTNMLIKVLAMDGHTFGDTAYWGDTFSTIPLPTLMQRLIAQRDRAVASDTVPALVDSATWNTLGLSAGALFSLALPGYTQNTMKFVAIERVDHLPTIFDSDGVHNQESIVGGGIFVDYQTLKTIYTQDIPDNTLTPNAIWLRTQHDQQTLSKIRTLLHTGTIQLQDRDALITHYHQDPLQNDLLFAQITVSMSVLILAFVTLLCGAWFNATQRQMEFAFLRALGTSKGQLRRIMTWEQMFIYGVGFLLGLCLGAILIQLIVPMLAFTQLMSDMGESSILAFDTPVVRMIIPINILAASLGIMLTLGLGALYLMTGQTMRTSMSQTLRLNQD